MRGDWAAKLLFALMRENFPVVDARQGSRIPADEKLVAYPLL